MSPNESWLYCYVSQPLLLVFRWGIGSVLLVLWLVIMACKGVAELGDDEDKNRKDSAK